MIYSDEKQKEQTKCCASVSSDLCVLTCELILQQKPPVMGKYSERLMQLQTERHRKTERDIQCVYCQLRSFL